MWILIYCEYVIPSFKKFTVLIIRNTEGTYMWRQERFTFLMLWSSLLHYKSLYINIYLVNNQSNHVLQQLEMHKEELGRHENVGFVTTKMRLLFFQNLQKRLLTCKRAWQKSTNALPTIVHDSLKPPRMILLSATGGHTGQFCELSSGNHHQ